MGSFGRRLVLFWLVASSAGCCHAVRHLFPPAATATRRSVYIISNGWHAGIVLCRADVRDDLWPELRDVPPTEYVEVGWGSREFYMARRLTPAVCVRALCWPSESVLHVAGFDGAPSRVFINASVTRVDLSDAGFEQLCRFLHASYEPDASGRPQCLGPGLYGVSAFYRARGRYYFPNTCNVWTARALRAAGCPVTPAYAAAAPNVVFQAGLCGERIK